MLNTSYNSNGNTTMTSHIVGSSHRTSTTTGTTHNHYLRTSRGEAEENEKDNEAENEEDND